MCGFHRLQSALWPLSGRFVTLYLSGATDCSRRQYNRLHTRIMRKFNANTSCCRLCCFDWCWSCGCWIIWLGCVRMCSIASVNATSRDSSLSERWYTEGEALEGEGWNLPGSKKVRSKGKVNRIVITNMTADDW